MQFLRTRIHNNDIASNNGIHNQGQFNVNNKNNNIIVKDDRSDSRHRDFLAAA